MPPIQPTTPATVLAPGSAAASGSAMGRDDFLLLLVAQLRHQDPLNPIQAQDFASQLAEFTAMEQQLRTNELLEAQLRGEAGRALDARESMALGFIGRTVLTEGDRLELADGRERVAHVSTGSAATFRIDLVDSAGNTVLSLRRSVPDEGIHRIELPQEAAALPEGSYSLRIEVETGQAVRPLTSQLVSGVRFDAYGPVLLTTGSEISLSDVIQITQTP